MTRLLRAAMVAVGLAAFVIADALTDDRTRGLVAALFPSDDDYADFLANPMGAFPGADPWGDGEAA